MQAAALAVHYSALCWACLLQLYSALVFSTSPEFCARLMQTKANPYSRLSRRAKNHYIFKNSISVLTRDKKVLTVFELEYRSFIWARFHVYLQKPWVHLRSTIFMRKKMSRFDICSPDGIVFSFLGKTLHHIFPGFSLPPKLDQAAKVYPALANCTHLYCYTIFSI